MHRAPAVSFRVARSVHHLALIAILWLVGVLSLLVLGAMQPLSLADLAALCLGLLLSGALALRGWQGTAVGLLRWDGAYWHWDGFIDESACALVLQLDLQHLLLVTVANSAGQRVWLWLEQRPANAHWRALRRAIVA
jgi:hypothetical protein